MYLEIDEGFDAHPKTVRLCRVMGDVNAGQYLIRLWAWACRSAPDGDLSGMEAGDIEAVCRYAPADGKLFESLTAAWSSKFGAWIDAIEGSLKIHGWGERQGAAIARMEKRASDMRALRDKRRREKEQNGDGTVTSRSSHVGSDVMEKINPDKTRPDKSSPDQSSQDPDGKAPEVAAQDDDGPLMPTTPERLKCCLDKAMQRARPERCPYTPGQWWDREAANLLRDLGDVAKVAPEILRRIGLFVADDRMSPWTMKRFCQEYNGIGVAKPSQFAKTEQPKASWGKAVTMADVLAAQEKSKQKEAGHGHS